MTNKIPDPRTEERRRVCRNGCAIGGRTEKIVGMTDPTEVMTGKLVGVIAPTEGMTEKTVGVAAPTGVMAEETVGMTDPTEVMTGKLVGMIAPTVGMTEKTVGVFAPNGERLIHLGKSKSFRGKAAPVWEGQIHPKIDKRGKGQGQ